MKITGKLVALPAVMLAVLALGPAPTTRAAGAPLHIFPPQARPYGHTYVEWAVQWQQWLNAIPKATSPMTNKVTPAICAQGQSGPVWYLVQAFAGTLVCTVPAGKAVLVTPANVEVSHPAPFNTLEKLRSDAQGIWRGFKEAELAVDGIQIPNVFTRYQLTTPRFTFAYPSGNIAGIPGGPGTDFGVSIGVYVMLAPLPPGQHTIEMRARGTWGAYHGTYHLTIR